MNEYGLFWRRARRKQGLTQKELGDRLGFSTPQFISNIERGSSRFPLDLLPKLIDVLELRPGDVVNLILREERRRIRRALAG